VVTILQSKNINWQIYLKSKCKYAFAYNILYLIVKRKNNKILLFEDKWIELENIILSEVSQGQKSKDNVFFSHILSLTFLPLH
jgi:hypothetical protein